MRKLHSRWLMAALSQAALSVTAVHAQSMPASVVTLSEVVVTAARMPQDPSLMPQGVQVITAHEIQAAGMTNANESIRWLGGVVGRTDTTGGRDQALDLRGFGEAASSNLVVLVDGVRQNEGDATGIGLSWIPISSIERIEIVRGSSAVLYGEGATAGAINIITQKGLAEPGGSVSIGFGGWGTRESAASLSTVSGPWRFQINGSARNTDNHRDNYATQERSALGRATWMDGSTLISMQLGLANIGGLLPGGLTQAQFNQNPRQTNTPGDNGATDSANLLISAETALDDWRIAADYNHRRRETSFDYLRQPSLGAVTVNSDRLGARLWREYKQGPVSQKILVGLDAEQWQQDSTGYVFRINAEANVKQTSSAVYVRHEMFFQPMGLKVFAGLRRTFADRVAVGNPPGEFAATNTSWDLGAALNLGAASEVFGKIGNSFRLPNANEYTCYVQYCPGGADKLLPQLSKDMELGFRQKPVWGQWTARLYRSNLTREIGYDPMIGNVNFDPTRREGIELDASTKLANQLDGGLQFAVRSASFRSGSYAGKTIPLVANRLLTARLVYRQSGTQRWLLTSQLVSAQRIGDDFDNTGNSKIAGYATLNLRYSHKVDAWTYAATANNLLDKRYFNYRTYSDETAKSVYPEAGRTFLVSAQRSF